MVGSLGIEPSMPLGGEFTVRCSHQCCSLPICLENKVLMDPASAVQIIDGADCQTRTDHLRVTRALLYQMS